MSPRTSRLHAAWSSGARGAFGDRSPVSAETSVTPPAGGWKTTVPGDTRDGVDSIPTEPMVAYYARSNRTVVEQELEIPPAERHTYKGAGLGWRRAFRNQIIQRLGQRQREQHADPMPRGAL